MGERGGRPFGREEEAAPWTHGKGEVELYLRAIPVRSFIQDQAFPPVVELHLGSGSPALELQGRATPPVERGGGKSSDRGSGRGGGAEGRGLRSLGS